MSTAQATQIEDLPLSTWVRNRLRGGGIHDIETLLQKSEEDLLDIKNFGRKSLQEVMTALERYRSSAI